MHLNKNKIILSLIIIILLFSSCSKASIPEKKVESESSNSQIIELDIYSSKLQADFNKYMPKSDILQMSGNGLQLFNSNNEFVSTDTILNCENEIDVFLRFLWLENYESDISIIIMSDNFIQSFKVDNNDTATYKYDFKIKPKSAINIPIKLKATSDMKKTESVLSFMVLYNNIFNNFNEEDSLQNAYNFLNYKITNYEKKEQKNIINCKNSINQIKENNDLLASKGLYLGFDKQLNNNFIFKEEQNLKVDNVKYLYCMGNGEYRTIMYLNNKIFNFFEDAQYIDWSLNDNSYFYHPINLPENIIGNENILTIINVCKSDMSKTKIFSKILS